MYKMNEIGNKFSLARDKYMAEMHLKQFGFTYSACAPSTKTKEIIKKRLKKEDIQDTFIKSN